MVALLFLPMAIKSHTTKKGQYIFFCFLVENKKGLPLHLNGQTCHKEEGICRYIFFLGFFFTQTFIINSCFYLCVGYVNLSSADTKILQLFLSNVSLKYSAQVFIVVCMTHFHLLGKLGIVYYLVCLIILQLQHLSRMMCLIFSVRNESYVTSTHLRGCVNSVEKM